MSCQQQVADSDRAQWNGQHASGFSLDHCLYKHFLSLSCFISQKARQGGQPAFFFLFLILRTTGSLFPMIGKAHRWKMQQFPIFFNCFMPCILAHELPIPLLGVYENRRNPAT